MLWLQIIENEKVKINWDPSVMMPLMTQKFMEPGICSFGMLNSKVLFFFTVVRTKTRIPGVQPVTKVYGTRDLQKGSILEKPGHIDLNSKFQSVVVFSTYTAIKKKERKVMRQQSRNSHPLSISCPVNFCCQLSFTGSSDQ